MRCEYVKKNSRVDSHVLFIFRSQKWSIQLFMNAINKGEIKRKNVGGRMANKRV